MIDNNKKRIGFFDIDGTIFRSSLLIELLNGLVRAGVFPKKAEKEMEEDYLAWLDRKGSYDNYLGKVINIYDRNIKGKMEEDIIKVVREVLELEKNKVYRFTRDLVNSMKKDGFILVAISGSPNFIVKPFAEYMGFDACYGSVFRTDAGAFTGDVENNDLWKDKRAVVEQFIKGAGFAADMEHSTAVGDSGADIPMLEAVGRPIAFNPDYVLADHAKRKGWQIIVERKNVVFEIKECTIKSY